MMKIRARPDTLTEGQKPGKLKKPRLYNPKKRIILSVIFRFRVGTLTHTDFEQCLFPIIAKRYLIHHLLFIIQEDTPWLHVSGI